MFEYTVEKTIIEGNIVMASEGVLFWQQKLAENQQSLDLNLIDANPTTTLVRKSLHFKRI
jgi:hypothetical protein